MSDFKLFRLLSGKATELRGDAPDLEKPLQNFIEANLEAVRVSGDPACARLRSLDTRVIGDQLSVLR